MAAIVPQMADGYSRDGSTLVRREYFDRSMETGAGGIYTTAEDLLRWNKALPRVARFITKAGILAAFEARYPDQHAHFVLQQDDSPVRVSQMRWQSICLD